MAIHDVALVAIGVICGALISAVSFVIGCVGTYELFIKWTVPESDSVWSDLPLWKKP